MATITFSVATGDDILDWFVRNQALANIATPFISLHTADPGATGASEVTGGSYVRQSALSAFGTAASSKSVASDAATEFAAMPAATVTHVGIWSASTVGTFHGGWALDSSEAVGAGETARLASGANTITIS